MILLVQARSSAGSELPLHKHRQPLIASVMVAQQIRRVLVTAPTPQSQPPPKDPLSEWPQKRQPIKPKRISRELNQNSNNSKKSHQELQLRSKESQRLKRLLTIFRRPKANKLTSKMCLNTLIKSSNGSLQLIRELISLLKNMLIGIIHTLSQNKIDFGVCLID